MVGIGEIVGAAGVISNVVDVLGDTGIVGQKSKSTSGDGPVRGARLEYNVPTLGGRLLIKEPFGLWLGLTPVYPEYGTFRSGDYIKGKTYTKRAGFRFKSYTILLAPGTKIKVPKATAAQQRTGGAGSEDTEDRQIGNITIGVSSAVAVHEFIAFLKSCKESGKINGLISPTLRKYQWGGVLHRAQKTSGGFTNPIASVGGIASTLGDITSTVGGIISLIDGALPNI